MSIFELDSGTVLKSDLSKEVFCSAAKWIFDYTVAFVIDNDVLGSGVLVEHDGRTGILTAGHVLVEFNSFDQGRRSICVSSRLPERVLIPSGSLVSIVSPPDSDWAIAEVLNPDLLGRIKARKLVLNLARSGADCAEDSKLRQRSMFVGGFVDEASKVHGSPPVKKMICFCGEGLLASNTSLNSNGEITFVVNSGNSTFPNNYRGVSGGGVWAVPIEVDPDIGPQSAKPVRPYLIQIATHQLSAMGGKRKIVGFGPRVLYEEIPAKWSKSASELVPISFSDVDTKRGNIIL